MCKTIPYPVMYAQNSMTKFTAMIVADENTSFENKLGLAVMWAVKNKVSLAYTDLCYANLLNAKLDGADFSSCLLRHATFTGASLVGAKFVDADISQACFFTSVAVNADFSGATARFANFIGADTSGAMFTESVVRGAKFCHPMPRL